MPTPAVPRPSGPSSASSRSRLAERLAALEAQHANPANPVAADEARRVGERPDRDESLTLEQAEANVLAALPGEVLGRYQQRPEGDWWNTATGEITETLPGS